MAKIYEIDPLKDARWPQLLEQHPQATLFHSSEWLGALQRTYGYRANALTTSAPGDCLTNALVFCQVQSWLTGRRLVSVPFSDYCQPLVEGDEELGCLLAGLKDDLDHQAGGYMEIRSAVGRVGAAMGMADSAMFCLHRLDLRPSFREIFDKLHESCIRRKLMKAERAGLTYKEGVSQELLCSFYELMIMTRRRHHLLPQPLSWFRNLINCFGDKAKIRIAYHQDSPVGAILTVRYKNTMSYKYGCSDSRFHRLGPMQLLMWKAIEEAKETGLLEFNMGLSDWDNAGLVLYKDRWGCSRSTLTYSRYANQSFTGRISLQMPKWIFHFAPNTLLSTAGGMLYPHIG